MIEVPSDGSETLTLILSVCKFIDLLLVLQTEEFQMYTSFSSPLHPRLSRATRHQWIFVTDTIDAVYRPDEIAPEAMLDQLSEIAGGLPTPQVSIRCHLSWIICVNSYVLDRKVHKFPQMPLSAPSPHQGQTPGCSAARCSRICAKSIPSGTWSHFSQA
jgi:hypothetical protein